MKNLFEPDSIAEVQRRLTQLRPESERQWGTMTPSQMLVHCSRAMEAALGDRKPPRMFIGRIVGGMVKRSVVGDDKPMGRNAPTAPFLKVREQPEFEAERARMIALVNRFAKGGSQACTSHPHTFFGPMSPEEWAILMYKHADHHLRQFGV
ncbi:MAG: DUF1569 domain-containing protein [Gemmatimonas sp.]|nr:DUF1569 domain-containing protein [Gemmatimonadaceae bacterium]